jgi:uncharacterized repeat protein (TIGR04076 family)
MKDIHINQKNKTKCPYNTKEILPNGICPLLYHSVYPYFLGLFYGAKFDYNCDGDANVCCPAINGVNTIVKKRNNDNSFDERINDNIDWVIFAEIVDIGECPHNHKIGQRFIFPTCMREHFICPAGLNNIFPFLDITIPICIDKSNLRCPDWKKESMIIYDI